MVLPSPSPLVVSPLIHRPWSMEKNSLLEECLSLREGLGLGITEAM